MHSNSVGPLVAVWMLWRTRLAGGDVDSEHGTQLAILMFGVFSMLVGLWVLGHKVIKTIGTDITHVTAPRYKYFF
jgi:phosphate/sulfate permease